MMKQYVLPVEVQPLEDGRFLAYCDLIQGCHAEGDTIPSALDNLQDVARVIMEIMKEDGIPLPKELRQFTEECLKEELLVVAPGP
jgi:predicted RNase H-like HicB family nuclease